MVSHPGRVAAWLSLLKRSFPAYRTGKNSQKCPGGTRETASMAQVDLSSRFAWSSASGSEVLHENICSVIKELGRKLCFTRRRSQVRVLSRPPIISGDTGFPTKDGVVAAGGRGADPLLEGGLGQGWVIGWALHVSRRPARAADGFAGRGKDARSEGLCGNRRWTALSALDSRPL